VFGIGGCSESGCTDLEVTKEIACNGGYSEINSDSEVKQGNIEWI
jgi:hypothetical protein